MKRENFFVGQYKKCWEFFKECRWYMVFVVGVFALLFLIGFLFPFFFRAEIFAFIEEMIKMLEGKGMWEIVWMIFSNNMKASFMAIVFGIGFGVVPLVTTVVNGYLLGFVAREVAMEEGISVLWQLFPHGIFELPAVIFSIGIGMRVGVSVFRCFGVSGGKRKKLGSAKGVGYVFREGLRFFVFVVFPLLLVAGIIEGVLIAISG
ncbi:MAG: stage II sporulation protein M [Nanoarchaeota archaeon]|nr:stage II sporulation protein M [Nanoarchaeota archaeon]